MAVLIHDCEVVATMDDAGTEIPGGSILIEDGVITWVGRGEPPAREGIERIDGRGTVALPGFVNTHLHLFQTLTRGRAQQDDLFGWLDELYRVWGGHVDPEWVYNAALVGLAELALSGCSLTTDHHYLHPNRATGLIEATIEAAEEIGVRFHPTRSSMNLGQKDGALPPEWLVEDKDEVLADCERLVSRFHDPSPGSMLQVAIGPCWPLNCSEELMSESVELARRSGVRMHTHIAEPREEERLTIERYGRRPVEFLDSIEMLGSDVWLAHCVQMSDADIARTAETSTGVAHCPTSNLRSGAGIAPVPAMLRAGVKVGIGVDSLALNDSGNIIAETRQALLVHRVDGLEHGLTTRTALDVATRGGAACLGRDDVGSLEAGKRGDVALFDVNGLNFVGAESDLVGAVLLCDCRGAQDLWVEGKPVVRGGRLTQVDEERLVAQAREITRRIKWPN
jgi:cytosine/adenosine deaminase-related metal-dependent hydrolase